MNVVIYQIEINLVGKFNFSIIQLLNYSNISNMSQQSFVKFCDILTQFYNLIETESYKNIREEKEVQCATKDFISMSLEMKEKELEENSLFVSKLYEKYSSISSKIFSFSEDEHLMNLFYMFERCFPTEAQQIKKYWNVYSFSNGSKHILLKGDIQSGKTVMMILTTLCYLVCNRDVVIILRCSNDDKTQFIDRFDEIVGEFVRMGYSNKNFSTYDICSKKNFRPESKCCFVTIYKEKNMEKIDTILRTRNDSFVVYVDEADLRDDRNDEEFLKLCTRCSTSIFVSGTVQNIMVSNWNILGENIINLIPDSSYKSVHDLKWNTDFDVATENGMYNAIKDISQDVTWNEFYSYHPKIILINVDRRISFLDKHYSKLIKDLPLQSLCVIKYGESRITCNHSSLSSLDKFPVPNYTYGDFEVKFSKSSRMTIKKLLLWMAQNGGVERFPNVIILAGDMANRGINFACYDPTEERNNWHITHQILYKSETSQCSTILQSLRILGKFTDNISLKVYTSEAEQNKILSSYSLTNELLDCVHNIDNRFYSEEYKSFTTDIICKQIPIKRSAVPRKFINKSICSSLNLVQDYEDGLNIMTEETNTDTSVQERGDGDIYLILPRKLSVNKSKQYYDRITSSIVNNNMCGRWMKKLEYIRDFISVDSNEATIINNTSWNWERHSRIIEDVNTPGLILKKINNMYWIRFNL